MHDVDATNLPTTPAVMATLRQRPHGRIVIIFQFPHNGTKKIHTQRKLLGNFFNAASQLIKPPPSLGADGSAAAAAAADALLAAAATPKTVVGRAGSEIMVSLSPGQGGTDADGRCKREWGNTWQVVNEAQRSPALLLMR